MMSEDLRSDSLRLLILLAVAVAIAGCGTGGGDGTTTEAVVSRDTTPAAADANPEIDLVGAWLLEDMGGRGVVDGVQTTMIFGSEGRVSGTGGCNRYTGSYTLENDRLTFGPLAGTKMMCPEAVMGQEDRFHKALADVERVTIDGDLLLIEITGSDSPLRFTRMESDVID